MQKNTKCHKTIQQTLAFKHSLFIHFVQEANEIWYLGITIIVICRYKNVLASEFLISFEAWTKLAQQWLVCEPLGIHLEPINQELMLLVTK